MSDKKVVVKMNMKEMEVCLCEMEEVLIWLELKLNVKKFKVSRKDEVLEILKEGKLMSVSDIGKRVGISNRNVSSILSYLRNDFEKEGDKFSIVKIGRGVGRLKLIEN